MSTDAEPDAIVKSVIRDELKRNPYIHFIQSELWAAVTGIVVYVFCRLGSTATDLIDKGLPVKDPTPAEFLGQVFSWCGAVGAAATFVIITAYQLIVLMRRLLESARNGQPG